MSFETRLPHSNWLTSDASCRNDLDAIAKAREVMDRQLAHMVRLIEDLLDVSRITRNKMELRKTYVLLTDIIHHASKRLHRPSITRVTL